MVAPLIVGAARLATRKAARKKGRRAVRRHSGVTVLKPANNSNIARNRGEKLSSRRQQDINEHQMDEEEYNQALQQQAANDNKIPRKKGQAKQTIKTAKKRLKQVKAGSVGFTITAVLAWFYIIQVLFSSFFVLALDITGKWEFINSIIPTKTIFELSWLVITVIGLGSMAYAAMAFTASGVMWLGKGKEIALVACCIAYITPFFFFFPWVFIWILVVVYKQE